MLRWCRFRGVAGAVVGGMGGHGLWLLGLRGVMWLGCRCSEGHGRVDGCRTLRWCRFIGCGVMESGVAWEFWLVGVAESGLVKGLQPTEPLRNGWGRVVLRPTHKFSRFSGIFQLGLTLHFFGNFSFRCHLTLPCTFLKSMLNYSYKQTHKESKLMRSEDEIREKIEQLKSNRDTVEFRSVPYYRCSSGIYFLEWVLQEDNQ